MALVLKDRVKETTTTTGTGTITLAGASSGFQSFSTIGNANTTYYTIVGGTEWEVGLGTYTSSSTTLSRDTILESSNGGTAVNFSAGTKDVFVTYPAEKSIYQNASSIANITSLDVTTALGYTPASGTVTSVTGTAPVSVATGTTTPVISMAAATTSVNGYLTSTDWTTFNSKAPATSGTSILYGNGSGGFSNVTVGSGLSFTTGTLSNSGVTSYPGAGIAVSTGSAWTTSFTAPSGAIVGTTDTQTLSAKTLTTPIISSISNTGTLTLPTSTDTLVGRATTDTLTNKRITSRVSTTTSSATPTINTDNTDQFGLTALAVNITSFTTNLTGTPTDGQKLWIYIVGTAARTIAWGASFEASTIALPTTTVTTARLDVGFVWNAATSKWRCVAVA
jgi:hypothetical protein